MPLPPMLSENGKPKKRRVTAVTMFTRDLKASRPDLRNLPMSSMQLISAASAAFDQLPFEKQRRYEQLAKAENKKYDELYGEQFRRDCEGAYLTEREEAAKSRLDYERYVADLVAELAGRVSSADTVASQEFVVGEVFEFIHGDERLDKGVYVPAEFGFVKFSLKRGVIDHLHCIVRPRDKAIPTYLTSQSREIIAETHQIPVDCPEAEENLARLCISLKKFCFRREAGTQWQLPIFVPEDHLIAMQKALIYAYNDPIVCEPCPFVKEVCRAKKTKVFPFEKLFTAVLACEGLPETKRMTGMLEGQVTRELNREGFTGEERACRLHREQDNLRYCALLRAHCHAWTLLKFAAKPYDLVMTPEHQPRQLEIPLPQPVKSNWFSNSSRRNASYPTQLHQARQRQQQPFGQASGGSVWQHQQRDRAEIPHSASTSACASARASVFDDDNDINTEFEWMPVGESTAGGGGRPMARHQSNRATVIGAGILASAPQHQQSPQRQLSIPQPPPSAFDREASVGRGRGRGLFAGASAQSAFFVD